MTEQEFKSKMRQAETIFNQSKEPMESGYSLGYMRGLLRAYHGETFGTEHEHEQWMSLADDLHDEIRRAKGEGYRDGLRGELRPRGVLV